MQKLTDSCECRCKGFNGTAQPVAAPAGARFRLLLLALRHCKQCQADATQRGVACPFAATMLLEKVLAIALQYFKAPPAWYGRWTKSEARSVETTDQHFRTQQHPGSSLRCEGRQGYCCCSMLMPTAAASLITDSAWQPKLALQCCWPCLALNGFARGSSTGAVPFPLPTAQRPCHQGDG